MRTSLLIILFLLSISFLEATEFKIGDNELFLAQEMRKGKYQELALQIAKSTVSDETAWTVGVGTLYVIYSEPDKKIIKMNFSYNKGEHRYKLEPDDFSVEVLSFDPVTRKMMIQLEPSNVGEK